MSQLAAFDQKLAQAKNIKEVLQIPEVKERAIKNYQATTGRTDGENRYEQERFAYLQLIVDKPDLAKVDKFYHFGAIVYALTTGLSFRDNKLYVIPNGNGLKIQSSPAGKREMLEMMPNVKSAPQAVLVMKGDLFVHDKANHKVIKHETTEKSSESMKLENIRAAYQRINYKDGSYIDTVVYYDDLVKAKSKSKAKSDQSFWNEWPGQACEKVATNRAFRLYHKYPDNVVLIGNMESTGEDESTEYAQVIDEPVNKGQTRTEQVDESTGEITQSSEDQESFM